MDTQSKTTQPISDDQELAKVLAGINAEDSSEASSTSPAVPSMPMPSAPPASAFPSPDAAENATAEITPPVAPPALSTDTAVAPVVPPGDDELDDVKKDAISELRPLVDKLNVPAEEKFDTYLLLIRSTDDKSLIAPAHDTAKLISDETRRAQALLDIIKEIDFLSNQAAPQK